jgi:demethylmenaquinone methyltransferase / 2-methoxy-6-polyprenyl-1,4-benzoquinol methylase
MAVVPYKNSNDPKKKQVAGMFDNISGRYDFLNHTLSFNIDKTWRRKAVKILENYSPKFILDVATGTGDFAIAASKIKSDKIIGVDISEGMLKVGQEKIEKKRLSKIIELKLADSENLPFVDNHFDAAIAGFGIRNFESLEAGLSEVLRVLKEEAPFVILEFSKPESTPFKQLYQFYFKNILPAIGRLVSKDKSAYTYLFKSVGAFPSGKIFLDVMRKVGFVNNKMIPLTFGIATIYLGHKPKSLM